MKKKLLVGIFVFFLAVSMVLFPSSVTAQDVPLEFAGLELGPVPEHYDRAVEMHLNAVYVCTALGNSPSSWQSVYQPLIVRGLKAIVLPGCWTYTNRMFNEAEVRPFLNWLRDNPVYKEATIAVSPIDEPYWTNGSDIDGDGQVGYSHSSLAAIYDFIKSESGGASVLYDLGSPLYWHNQGRRLDGIADYLAWYVAEPVKITGASSSYNQAEVLGYLNQNYDVVSAAKTKLMVLIRTWTWSGSMAMGEEMIRNLTCDVLNTKKASGLIYYPYTQDSHYSDSLGHHPEMFDDVRAAIDQCAYGYGTVPPTSTPGAATPSPTTGPSPTPTSTPPPGQLVAEYLFNEGSGQQAFDTSGNNLHAVLSGPAWTSGRYGSGLEFDGSNDFVNADDPSLLDLNHYTLMAWVKQETRGSGHQEIMEKADAYWVNIRYDTGKLRSGGLYGVCPPDYSGWKYLDSSSTVPLNSWTHVTTTYDGSALKIYINGVEDASLVVSDTTCFNSHPLIIGAKHVPGVTTEGLFDGIIDEVRLYSRALSQTEIIAAKDGSGFHSPTPTPSQEHCPRKPQGDANCDGNIDGIDYSMWLNSQCRPSSTQTCADTRADFNNDGNIDDEDYNIWFKNRETGTTPTPTSTPPPNATPSPSGNIGYYGIFNASEDEFSTFDDWGMNFVIKMFNGIPQSQWASIYEQAIANNIKLIATHWGGWETGGLQTLLNFIESNEAYKNATLAVQVLHEPCNPQQQHTYSHAQRVAIYSQLRADYPWAKFFSEQEHVCSDYGPGEADYDRITLYNFAYAGGQPVWNNGTGLVIYDYEQAKQAVRERITQYMNHARNSGANVQLAVKVQTFAFEPSFGTIWNRMPTANEMRDWAHIVMERDDVWAFYWYPWDNPAGYSYWLSKDRTAPDGDRWQVVAEIGAELDVK